MIYFSYNTLTLLQFDKITNFSQLVHCISTRIGGVSKPPYDSLNISYNVGDLNKNVNKNRELVCEAIGISPNNVMYMEQTHSANVISIKNNELNFNKKPTNLLKNVDAIVTNIKNLPIVALSADCAIILFFDPVHKILALAHCGWKGVMLNICSNVIRQMMLDYGTEPKNVFVGIGPTISCENYDVGRNRIDTLRKLFHPDPVKHFYKIEKGTYHICLQEIIIHQLQTFGIINIEISGICTSTNINLLYSHHKEGLTGRFGTFAYIAR